MDERSDGRDGELPFEAEPHVDHDADHGHDNGDRAAGNEFGRNRGTHDLGTAILDGVAERLLHLGDGGLLLGFLGLRGDADQHLVRRSERLDLDLAEAQRVELTAQGTQICGVLLGFHLNQRAALEIDAHVEADRGDKNERHDGQECRHEPGDGALTDEIDLGIRRNKGDAVKHIG